MEEKDDYEIFLETWEPGERLRYASLAQYQADPVAQQRLLDDTTGESSVERAPFVRGLKEMDDLELSARLFSYFDENQGRWAAEFRDYLLAREVPKSKIDVYNTSFSQHWVDGRKRRQHSADMLAIKASIRDHDQEFHPRSVDRFVIHPVDAVVEPLFTPKEMATVFEANSGLIDAFLPDYIDELGAPFFGSISDLHVRRGVYMPGPTPGPGGLEVVRELHYLSSYSLSLGPVEQFAQTFTPATRGSGFASIFSAPIAAVQTRIVAFAPFVSGMALGQLEVVVAPPLFRTPLRHDGEYGGIHEFSFR